MSINYRSVYLAQSTYDFRVCRLADVSLYAPHLYALLEAASYACPSCVALEMAGEKMTYEALSGRVNLCALGLQRLGAEQGDVIAFSMEKSISLIVALLAALKIGAKVCVLPQAISALRLRAIQQGIAVDFLINASGTTPMSQYEAMNYASSLHTISYEQLILAGVQGGSMSVGPHTFMSATQIVINCDVEKGLYPLEFPQSLFLKTISQLDNVLPALRPDQKILMTASVTQPRFLLELFYAFSRQLTCVLTDKQQASGESRFAGYTMTLPIINAARVFLEEYALPDVCAREIAIEGLQVSLKEVEYFARQYPGVTQAKAIVSLEGLELCVQFSWDFYPAFVSRSVDVTALHAPGCDIERLASRLFYFLSQHLCVTLPIKAIILQPE